MKKLLITFFTKRPLVANCMTYGSLYLGAEFSQQYITRKVMVNMKNKIIKATFIKQNSLLSSPNPPRTLTNRLWRDTL